MTRTACGAVWRGQAWTGKDRPAPAWCGEDPDRLGAARPGEAWPVKARMRLGTAWHGMARLGTARCGADLPGTDALSRGRSILPALAAR